MYTKQHASTGGGYWIGLAILIVGVAIGSLTDPLDWIAQQWEGGARADSIGRASSARETPEQALHPYLHQPDGSATAAAENGLETLRVTLPEESARVLQAVHDRSLESGLIIQEDSDTVPAEFEFRDKHVRGTVRIKGDWLDHIKSDKWSMRVELKKETLLGMGVFSIQAPQTRGMLWEWLALAMARYEGVLAPRSTFVNVELNGHAAGVYYLEEHFSKELLESQQRREGAIVRWDESTYWNTRLQSHLVKDANWSVRIPPSLNSGHGSAVAEVRGFGEKRLSEIESLSRGLAAAIEQMRDLNALMAKTRSLERRAWITKELIELDDATIASTINVEVFARYHALLSVLQVKHSLAWHNLRFYHDPVLDRLEPISFDNMAFSPAERAPLLFRYGGTTPRFLSCRRYYEGVFRELGRLCRPEWLDQFFDQYGDELARYEAALQAEKPLHAAATVDGMKQRLRIQQGYLLTLLYPDDPINVEAFYTLDDPEQSRISGTFEVAAWATSLTPTVVEGFRLSNGTMLAAEDCLVSGVELVSRTSSGGIVIPHEGTTVRFRFPIDQRLAGLQSARDLRRAVLEDTESKSSVDFEVDLVYRSIATDETQSERLRFRRYDQAWREQSGRPEAPGFEETLAKHPFLRYDDLNHEFETTPGVWDVDGDLVVPRGYALRITAGTELRFEEDAVLLSEDAVHLLGTEAERVRLMPREGADRWRGIAILNAPEPSNWTAATITNTDAIARKGWVTTGGITFYRSPIRMRDCHIEGTLAEDGCNFFATDIQLEYVTFSRCVSDSLDGDFITGRIANCTFEDGLADGVDFSGSRVEVVDCRFINMGDKAVSAGEGSEVRVQGGVADGVSIGIASKDRSVVEVDGFKIHGARMYALAVFVKKDEFGSASLTATNMDISGSGLGDTLVQTDCTLLLNGTPVATQDLDVGQLYRDKILGQ